MRKGQDYDYHKLNTSMVISDTSHDGDEKLYFIYYFFHLNIFMFFFLPSTICCCVLNYIATFFSSPGKKKSRWTIAITWRPSSVLCRLSSVVCKLFTFQASSPKPLGRLEPNLARMFIGWSSTKLLFFVPVGYLIWLPGPIICSDWLKFQRSSSPKLMNWLNPNCKEMIIGMSFTKLLFFMPIGNPRWPPSQGID
jgi:hypothetical protein